MARLVLVISKSGTGKSSSLRNLKKGEASVVLCSGKEMPFRTDISTLVPKSHLDVINAVEKANAPIVVIDDANYLMSFEEMNRATEIGYVKFTQMATHMFDIFQAIIKKESDQTFYVMAHSAETEDGSIKFKTTGKMLSEKIVLEGLTNILITNEITSDGEFVFRVRTDGTGVKTPLGMFKTDTVPNDLVIVDKAIKDFYGPTKKETK
jgi:NAD kinase